LICLGSLARHHTPARPAKLSREEHRIAQAMASRNQRFDVGGVLMDRPFKIQCLGHFGCNVDGTAAGYGKPRPASQRRVVDPAAPWPEAMAAAADEGDGETFLGPLG
jgi:hypothetical protein